jgi:hypothetical protein
VSDALLVAVALVLIVLTPFDIYVAWRLSVLAMQKPRIPSLTGAALRSVAIAVAGTLFAILGFHSIWFAYTGVRLLPTPVPTLLIVIGAIVISLPNIYFLRLLHRFADEANEWRRHKRNGDQAESLHRRATDEPHETEL